MAYVAVDDDDRLEEGPEGLQFKSFNTTNTGVGNADRGYLQDHPHPSKSNASFWNVEYYQSYFDIDTQTVLTRCYSTLLPFSQSFSHFIASHLNPPDLYGPFWTLTTLIFTLFLSSSLAASISAYLSAPGEEYDYDFRLLSTAVGLVYAYGLAVPVLLWVALRYLGVGEWSVVEAVAVWGYGMFVWIPVSILCVIPVPIVRWSLVTLAFASSGFFLVRNVYPILASAEAKALRLLIIILVLLHAGIALCFQLLFFEYYVVKKIGVDPGDVLNPDSGSEGGASTTSAIEGATTTTEAVARMVRTVLFR
ncbi:Yip1-domain-containing protein [Dendrothele bispora CBS 962.96]|uniref:Protein YIP n=1 Tax=Dendrothele bispora (strain CBS 962.96) TaxID=1314807 RepID=A0A4S8MIG5_DENBC|nr:Yip1-domain-containing protein [Dendrothele bispora CBS 962.96]